jgi:hypothetical protein
MPIISLLEILFGLRRCVKKFDIEEWNTDIAYAWMKRENV